MPHVGSPVKEAGERVSALTALAAVAYAPHASCWRVDRPCHAWRNCEGPGWPTARRLAAMPDAELLAAFELLMRGEAPPRPPPAPPPAPAPPRSWRWPAAAQPGAAAPTYPTPPSRPALPWLAAPRGGAPVAIPRTRPAAVRVARRVLTGLQAASLLPRRPRRGRPAAAVPRNPEALEG